MLMLSNQLIKNNTIALTELAKNSYDADASWVQIRIGNMDNYNKKVLKESEKPYVEIEDDGIGMSLSQIQDSWINPATPEKYIKRKNKKAKTKKGRIIQGEKGIGRFAVFQIGKVVEIHTRKKTDIGGGEEINLLTDLTKYDDDMLTKKEGKMKGKILYFDEIKSKYNIWDNPRVIKPGIVIIEGQTLNRKKHGTKIKITELNYNWTERKVRDIRKALSKLQSPFRKQDFAVSIYFNREEITAYEQFDIHDVFEEALIKMEGDIDEFGMCDYYINNKKYDINLIENLQNEKVKENRMHFLSTTKEYRKPECGPFSFKFYVYNPMLITDNDMKQFIQEHRTYIYRDGIRVYPYGDKDNDWIKLDIYRGWIKVGDYLSNNQLIGYIEISSQKNPYLIDKTSREGLIEQSTAYDDLRLLVLSILNELHIVYKRLTISPSPKRIKARRNRLFIQSSKVQNRIITLDKYLESEGDSKGSQLMDKLKNDYNKEREVSKQQIELVEDLAGVGIAVDATSHDVMVMMGRARETVMTVHEILKGSNPNLERLEDKVEALEGQIMFIESLLSGIQPIFRSARRKNKNIRLIEIINKVRRYYEKMIDKNRIEIEINTIGPPLIIKSSEGILLQIFINLFDNAIFWIKVKKPKLPKILILVDGDHGSIIFSDNGTGVKKEDVDFIFEPFFSTKGVEGRGLGLYIARQLSDKYGYDLYYLKRNNDKMLSGANFKLDFIEEG